MFRREYSFTPVKRLHRPLYNITFELENLGPYFGGEVRT